MNKRNLKLKTLGLKLHKQDNQRVYFFFIGNTNFIKREKTPSRCIEHAPRREEDYNRLTESIEKVKETTRGFTG